MWAKLDKKSNRAKTPIFGKIRRQWEKLGKMGKFRQNRQIQGKRANLGKRGKFRQKGQIQAKWVKVSKIGKVQLNGHNQAK